MRSGRDLPGAGTNSNSIDRLCACRGSSEKMTGLSGSHERILERNRGLLSSKEAQGAGDPGTFPPPSRPGGERTIQKLVKGRQVRVW